MLSVFGMWSKSRTKREEGDLTAGGREGDILLPYFFFVVVPLVKNDLARDGTARDEVVFVCCCRRLAFVSRQLSSGSRFWGMLWSTLTSDNLED